MFLVTKHSTTLSCCRNTVLVDPTQIVLWGAQLPGADRGQPHCTAAGRANFTPDDFRAIFIATCAGAMPIAGIRLHCTSLALSTGLTQLLA